jgi:transglutaminase-like putative cysteine protease
MENITVLRKIVIFVLIFTGWAASLFAAVPEEYRTALPDPLIKNMPASVTAYKSKGAEVYLQKVAEYIAEKSTGEFDKVKKIHDWVALNIRYNTAAYFSGNIPQQSVERVVSSGLAVCAGYSEVFSRLCDYLEVECEIVTGYARGLSTSLFQKESPYSSNHAWNKVKIEGQWYLIDTTWDSGYVNGRSFVRKYKTDYLFPKPDFFIYDHFPLDPEDQLISPPVSAEYFIQLPRVRPDFFDHITGLSPNLQCVTEIRGRFFRMDVSVPPAHYLMFNLFNKNKTSQRNSFYGRMDNGKYTLTFHFSASGTYRMWMYSSLSRTGTYTGIGEFGFLVEIPKEEPDIIPGEAEVLYPEGRTVNKNTRTEFKIKPGKWKHIALIKGNSWQYLSPDEEGLYAATANIQSSGIYYIAASETETGVYETLAAFQVK